VGLADVYDALTSARVYKAAYSSAVARGMIEAEIGQHFDPAVVEAFLASYDEFQTVQADFDESREAAATKN
jgi:putative two-component system response regulator